MKYDSAFNVSHGDISHLGIKSVYCCWKNYRIVTIVRRLVGYFCSDTVCSFSRMVLTDTEIKVLEKDLEFAPLQNRINEPKASGFEEFARRMRTK